MSAAAALVESTLEDNLKKFLNKNIVKKELTDDVSSAFIPLCSTCALSSRVCLCVQLGVLDAKLGGVIKESMGIPCVFNQSVLNVVRGIRSQVRPRELAVGVRVCV